MRRGKRKLCSFNEKQDAMPSKDPAFQDLPPFSSSRMRMVCSRCSKSGEVASSTLSEQVASKLSAILFSLASFNGDKLLRTCSGICIKSLKANTISIMTSLSLVSSYDGEINISDISKIEVKLPNGQVIDGKLGPYNDHYDLAIVNIDNVPGFQAEYLSLDHDMLFDPNIEVVAASRFHDTGEFKATTGTLKHSYKHHECVFSTCKIEKAGIGGLLTDYDGNFIGMNNVNSTEITERILARRKITPCVPRDKVLKCLRYFGMFDIGLEQESDITTESITFSAFHSDTVKACIDYAKEFQMSHGYPLPDPEQACESMHLNYSFEDEFGGDIWSILSRKVATKVSRSVVSLASFNGKTRFFACTGVFIDRSAQSARILTSASLVRNSDVDVHKINHNMRIEVRLPNDRRVKGRLIYCNLCYNIALVDIIGSCSPQRMKLQEHMPVSSKTDLVAVGCLFYTHKLMATKGVLIGKNTDKQGQLDCQELSFSTCKITKAGIGGPLIDMCGNIVGMNFYDEECTPFLPSNIILNILKYDLSKYICAKCPNDAVPTVIGGGNRWPVIAPCWHYPETVEYWFYHWGQVQKRERRTFPG